MPEVRMPVSLYEVSARCSRQPIHPGWKARLYLLAAPPALCLLRSRIWLSPRMFRVWQLVSWSSKMPPWLNKGNLIRHIKFRPGRLPWIVPDLLPVIQSPFIHPPMVFMLVPLRLRILSSHPIAPLYTLILTRFINTCARDSPKADIWDH